MNPDNWHRIKQERIKREAAGLCADTSMTIAECWDSEICDCAFAPPLVCAECGVSVWDIHQHRELKHGR